MKRVCVWLNISLFNCCISCLIKPGELLTTWRGSLRGETKSQTKDVFAGANTGSRLKRKRNVAGRDQHVYRPYVIKTVQHFVIKVKTMLQLWHKVILSEASDGKILMDHWAPRGATSLRITVDVTLSPSLILTKLLGWLKDVSYFILNSFYSSVIENSVLWRRSTDDMTEVLWAQLKTGFFLTTTPSAYAGFSLPAAFSPHAFRQAMPQHPDRPAQSHCATASCRMLSDSSSFISHTAAFLTPSVINKSKPTLEIPLFPKKWRLLNLLKPQVWLIYSR